jgi:hypothetical protein
MGAGVDFLMLTSLSWLAKAELTILQAVNPKNKQIVRTQNNLLLRLYLAKPNAAAIDSSRHTSEVMLL